MFAARGLQFQPPRSSPGKSLVVTSLERPLHFLHIGKTGGTAVKHALKSVPAARQLVIHGHGTRLCDVAPGEQVFFLLRDPLSRFVSAFYSRQREGRPRYVVPWTPEEEAAFGRFHTANALANALSSTSSAERTKAERAMRNIAHVNSRYWVWLSGPDYLHSRGADIQFIGMQENLAEDFAILRTRLGLLDTLRLPDDDVAAHRNPAAVDRSLDETAIRNLSAWYAEDFVAISECRRLARDRQLGGAISA
jgi:hypothetical protein